MKRPTSLRLCALLLLLDSTRLSLAEPTSAAASAFNAYTSAVELRLAQQHRTPSAFLYLPHPLQPNELFIERLSPATGADLPGALLHHWRGTAFAPGARSADFERLMRDFSAYPQRFAPQVTEASLLSGSGDHFQAKLRVRQHHILTVTMDTAYDITFGRLGPSHGYSISRSTHIEELDASNHALSDKDSHGFLWRLNTYWSYEERDGGLLLQVESVSLSRGIPHGLGWAVRPYIDSVPRESLEFTLRSAVAALRK